MPRILPRIRTSLRKAAEAATAVATEREGTEHRKAVTRDHPAVVHADPSRMDAETRWMYLDAKAAHETQAEQRAAELSEPRFVIRRPFQTGFVIALGVITAVTFAGILSNLGTVIMYVVGALFIALGLDPVVRFLERRRIKRPLAISLVFVVFLGIVAGVLSIIIPVVADQVTILIRRAPGFLMNIRSQPWYGDLRREVDGFIDVDEMLQIAQNFAANPDNWASVAGGVWQAGLGIANGVTATIIVLILTLYFLASLRAMKRGFYSLIARSRRARVMDITEQVTASVGHYVSGQVMIAFTNSLLGFIMMSIIKVPFAAVVAVVVFLLALIPLVGALMATAVVTTVALFASPGTALIALVYYLLYMQIEAYVLTPRVMNRVVQVPGALVVIGALTGGTLLGVVGALIAIPVTAAVLMIVKQVLVPAQELR